MRTKPLGKDTVAIVYWNQRVCIAYFLHICLKNTWRSARYKYVYKSQGRSYVAEIWWHRTSMHVSSGTMKSGLIVVLNLTRREIYERELYCMGKVLLTVWFGKSIIVKLWKNTDKLCLLELKLSVLPYWCFLSVIFT